MPSSRKTRRDFFRSAAALGALGVTGGARQAAAADAPQAGAFPPGEGDRAYWVSVLDRISRPVLERLARRELRKHLPVEAKPGARASRAECTHLEAFGRLLYGISPWLACEGLQGAEGELRRKWVLLVRECMDAATDPRSPDFMNFSRGTQPLVDAAFLAQGILRAPKVLWQPLDARVKQQVIEALKSSRAIHRPAPRGNNWVMFAATVEAALLEFGESTVPERLEGCVRTMLGWYCGDGTYGDGPHYHCDYYNSFVIQPMLIDVLGVLAGRDDAFAPVLKTVLRRARRHAEVQERMIAPDGTFPPLGRSLAYRFGALQLLGQIALRGELPAPIHPAQVRCAMTAVIRRMMEVPGVFDDGGWLRIGFCGHQPGLGESYVSTGSLYLCSAGLLPLGLPPSDPFWSAPAAKWTQQKIWSGEDCPADHALGDVREVAVPDLRREAGGAR